MHACQIKYTFIKVTFMFYCYVRGIYGVLFTKKATIAHLKILINNSANIDPSKDLNACEDFFLVTLHAHIITAARSILRQRQFDRVEDLAKEVNVQFLYFSPDVKLDVEDKNCLQVLTLILWHGFNDVVHEGDGDHVLIY